MGDNKKDFKFGDLKKFLKPKAKTEEVKEHEPIVEQYEEFIEKIQPKKVKPKKKVKPATITCGICNEKVPENFYDDHFAKCKADEELAERIAEGVEIEEIQSEIQVVIEKIEKIEVNWDLPILQKLITVKNVLNYSQTTWSLGVCNEILGEGSLRGSTKKVGSGLIKTIKKICKLR